ncbi:hypothetical protein WPS_01770 [Vulcanimicrobium alpinum]|uniref:Uncharacterized protein n=1 Tax=Vulcanimicrobium alpinum TaxID=3016050 RepID=A0AAN2C8D0_UNVUL|nr:hypothetical protein WPS_01770 [Vulcanimicrobium alpinum]
MAAPRVERELRSNSNAIPTGTIADHAHPEQIPEITTIASLCAVAASADPAR